MFNFNTLEQRAEARQKVKDVYGDDLTVYSGLDAPGKCIVLVWAIMYYYMYVHVLVHADVIHCFKRHAKCKGMKETKSDGVNFASRNHCQGLTKE